MNYRHPVNGSSFPESEIIYSKMFDAGWRFGIAYSSSRVIQFDMYFDASAPLVTSRPLFISVEVTSDRSAIPSSQLVDQQAVATQSKQPVWLCRHDLTRLRDYSSTRLTIIFTVAYVIPLWDLAVPRPIINSLKVSLSTGHSVDTRFFAYSRRLAAGKVGGPLPLYADSFLLKDKSSYFDTLLSNNGFTESLMETLDTEFPVAEESTTENYDYESDSDLSDFSDEDGTPQANYHPKVGVVNGQRSQVNCDAVDDDDTASSSAIKKYKITSAPIGRSVVVKDVAYKTLRALVFYLYTNQITFAPLQSASALGGATGSVTIDDDLSPPLFPQVYIGLDGLKVLAFEAIKKGLSENNIVEEAFSKFTSRYSEIRKVEIDILHQNCRTPQVRQGYMQTMKTIGGEERFAEVAGALFDRLTQ
ncbi:hypothetical protein NEOLEDRAFT_693383 [Neolentinus lepideus HHB14362 ss-1]|uniref:BTB domain-containing protein n=1 Tax=Neolentinus lepideus HHB14362 ss-1 TaxID=1314782 RepID=A0A165V247_9AGAM|nr:hypothetical protein NEOLEDRAFT_693383 [Neolentinus lepideus HHB14362 ss-1]